VGEDLPMPTNDFLFPWMGAVGATRQSGSS
jgi:hypothetical protein